MNPRTPESMLFVVEERREGLKYNIDFGGGVSEILGFDLLGSAAICFDREQIMLKTVNLHSSVLYKLSSCGVCLFKALKFHCYNLFF